ncbi:MAG: ABC transporter ATP-binding protein [Mycoplasmoidaceae bacterium]|nr:ABC transporter ATP-binding protein [Mycoplasmoidaceae bacterium]
MTKTNAKKLIEVKNLCKEFGKGKNKIKAVNDISFDIYDGQNVALVGSNGAGKTTTVEILAGLNKPTSGTITYNLGSNKPINELIGIQFQDSVYPNGLSVKRIVKFVIDAYNSNITKEELEKLIDIFGVRSFYRKNARSLSGGQSQRLNVLLALLHKPKVVFLDELSTGMDITIRTRIKHFIKDYCQKNNTNIILVSHDMAEIEYIAERLIVMQNGKIVSDVLIKDVVKGKNTLEQYLTKYIVH